MKKIYGIILCMLLCSMCYAQTIRQVSLASCSGGTWDIHGLPEGTPVMWYVTGNMSIQGANNRHFVALEGAGGSGVASGTLNVTFTYPGGSHPTTLSKEINMEPLRIKGATTIQTNTYGGTFYVEHFPEATGYEWEIYPNSGSFSINGQGTNYITLANWAPAGGYSLTLKISTRCGIVYAGEHAFSVSGPTGGPGGGGQPCTSGCEEEPWFVYPNPAVAELHIETTAEQAGTHMEAVLYDARGQVRKSGSTQHSKLKLDTSDLPKGVYYLYTTDGKKKTKKQILIEK